MTDPTVETRSYSEYTRWYDSRVWQFPHRLTYVEWAKMWAEDTSTYA